MLVAESPSGAFCTGQDNFSREHCTRASSCVALLGSYARLEQVLPGLRQELLPVLLWLPHLGAHIKIQRQALQMRGLQDMTVLLASAWWQAPAGWLSLRNTSWSLVWRLKLRRSRHPQVA